MRYLLPCLLLLAFRLCAQQSSASPPNWIARSNQNAQLLIDIESRYSPESSTGNGVQGLDDRISRIDANQEKLMRADYANAQAELEKRLAAEKDPLVRQDLGILIKTADRRIRESEADRRRSSLIST